MKEEMIMKWQELYERIMPCPPREGITENDACYIMAFEVSKTNGGDFDKELAKVKLAVKDSRLLWIAEVRELLNGYERKINEGEKFYMPKFLTYDEWVPFSELHPIAWH